MDISKSSLRASGVIPAVPGKKENSPEKAPDSTTLILNHPLEKSYFPYGLSGDVRTFISLAVYSGLSECFPCVFPQVSPAFVS